MEKLGTEIWVKLSRLRVLLMSGTGSGSSSSNGIVHSRAAAEY